MKIKWLKTASFYIIYECLVETQPINLCCGFQTKAAPTGKPQAKKQHHIRGKGQKKKKISLKFTVDCTHPVEDNIMDVASFVSNFFNTEI